MSVSRMTPVLTHQGALLMLTAAVARAEAMGRPQCIVIVDPSGVTLASLRMTGARYLSMDSARAKARTAASIRAPSSSIPESTAPVIAAATGGQVTRLDGGFPIVIEDEVVGGIGVGSGTPQQDIEVAEAALAALATALET